MQAANSIPHDPPEIVSLETELICLTTNTKDCKPVRFHSDLLLKKHNTMKLRKYLRKFWKTLKHIAPMSSLKSNKINLLLADDARAA
ncbi:AVB_G0047050.mRNA.1.CDS.1 [Saccharomyces cerevisiae]|nr:AVB_G0047050.mRNA.1.CDS.1 [Saccharomyces cerevisiae]CAI7316471.1 AVB_G0047050.mRNA.1.CDS.1 [Saccharomyces cerevisiae]